MVEGVNELALFAGAGGGILGGHLLGWRTICAVERSAYAASVLVARQNEGLLAPFPIWDDVQTFDGRAWRGRVDVVSGGFPCQDISAAGAGAGIDGERSGLWLHMARIVGEVRPRFAFVENSPMLTSRGLGRVLGDLASMGYDARWCVLGACDAGAPHERERIWILASDPRHGGFGEPVQPVGELGCSGAADAGGNGPIRDVADANSVWELQPQRRVEVERGWPGDGGSLPSAYAAVGHGWWAAEPDVGRMAHGVAARVDRLTAIGNGQVPAVAKLAWETLT